MAEKVKNEVKTEKTEEQIRAEAEAYMNERVPYVLVRPSGELVTERTVTVNGRNFQIQYNKQVMLPRYVVQFLEQIQKQERKTEDLIISNLMKQA